MGKGRHFTRMNRPDQVFLIIYKVSALPSEMHKFLQPICTIYVSLWPYWCAGYLPVNPRPCGGTELTDDYS